MTDILRVADLPDFPRDPNFILKQTNFWQNIEAKMVMLSEIDASYARNIINMLERQAFKIKQKEINYRLICGMHPLLGARGDMAMDAQDRELHDLVDMEHIDFLHTLPLVQALVKIRDTPKHDFGANPFPRGDT